MRINVVAPQIIKNELAIKKNSRLKQFRNATPIQIKTDIDTYIVDLDSAKVVITDLCTAIGHILNKID